MPTNPGVNAPQPESAGEMSRRRFFQLVGFGALAATAAGSAIGGLRYIFPTVLYEPPNRIKIGLADKFGPDTVTFIAEKTVFIRRTPEGFQAISAVCQHLGCTVSQGADGYVCPCHGSIYGKDGEILAGPAPRGLDHFAIEPANDGQLVVDLGKIIDKTAYYKA